MCPREFGEINELPGCRSVNSLPARVMPLLCGADKDAGAVGRRRDLRGADRHELNGCLKSVTFDVATRDFMCSHHTSTNMSYRSLTVKTAATVKFLTLAHLPKAKACLGTAVNYHRCLILCKSTVTAEHCPVPSALGYLAVCLVRRPKERREPGDVQQGRKRLRSACGADGV